MTQSAKQTILRLPLWILLLRLVPLAGGLALALTVRHWAALVGAAQHLGAVLLC